MALKIKKFGWKKDSLDPRDFKFKAAIDSKQLPKQVNLISNLPKVYNQANLGSCSSNAVAAAIEFDRKKQKLEVFTPSRLFIYYNTRVLEGTVNEDSGASLRNTIKSVANLGGPRETIWPYASKGTKFKEKPPIKVYKEALPYKVVKYHKIPQTLNELQSCLAEGYPFVLGILVYEEIESEEVAKTGILPLPKPTEAPIGAHAVCHLPGAKITTKKGCTPIEEIKIGDEVLTHTGTFKKVTNTFTRNVVEELIYIIENRLGNNLKVTKEHPIFTKKYSLLTKLKQTKNCNTLTKDIQWQEAQHLTPGNLLYYPIYKIEKEDNANLIYEEDFFELLGMYIGDGNISIRYNKNKNIKSASLRLTIGKKYISIIERYKELITKYTDNSIKIDNFKNHINIVCYNTTFAKKIGNLCGFAKNKNIIFSILEAPLKYQRAFLKGWCNTDGCRSINNICISTAEENLKDSLLFILARLNLLYSYNFILPRKRIIKNKIVNTKGLYNIWIHNIDENFNQIRTKHTTIYAKDYLIQKIVRINKLYYSGEVYNLEIEEDNSYVVENVVVHNCAVGYDQDKKIFLARNSWGQKWGQNGSFTIPFEYVINPELASDFWTIRVVS